MELSQEAGEGRFAGYGSPWRALAWSFHKSRENWKRKYLDVKREVKRTRDKSRDLSKSREQWKERAKSFEAEKKALEVQLSELQALLADQVGRGEKKGLEAVSP